MKQSEIRIDIPVDGEYKELIFQKESDRNCYISDDNEISILIENNTNGLGNKYTFERLNVYYKKINEILLGKFSTEYEKRLEEEKESYESGFEYDEYEEDSPSIKVPYDPDLITVAPAKFSLKEIVNMIDGEDDEEPVLDLAPAFQRDYVWDNVRKSRLIESILLNIPLPIFYFSRDKNGKLQVVDGLQRLTTIYKYFHNEFKLTNLEYLKNECEGKFFKKNDLPEEKSLKPKLVRALRQYQIDCNVIEPSTPENVKLDIFKRLNTGGKELNKQEVRHSFMRKNVREFIKKLVESEEFKAATDNGVNDKRMMAQELILRYIGFYCLYIDNFLNITYTLPMDDFLDKITIELNNSKKIPYDKIEKAFMESMRKAVIMFGKNSFRKVDLDENDNIIEKRNPINKSLFIAFSISLCNYSQDIIMQKGNIVKEFAYFLKNDKNLYDAISHNTNYQLKEKTMGLIEDFLMKLYKTRR